VIRPELANDPDCIRRFEAEAQLVARLEHPRVVPLYDYWREPAPPTWCCAGCGAAAWPMRWRGDRWGWSGRLGSSSRSPRRWWPRTGRGSCTATSTGQRAVGRGRGCLPVGLRHHQRGRRPAVAPDAEIQPLSVTGVDPRRASHAPHRRVQPGGRAQGGPGRGEVPAPVAEVIVRATAERPEERYPDAAGLAQALGGTVGQAPVPLPAAAVAPNPYLQGPGSFQEAEAGDFFGREALTARLVARLAGVSGCWRWWGRRAAASPRWCGRGCSRRCGGR
jgi:hypothetical protein